MNEIGVGSLESILPEMILLVGGILVLILDMLAPKEQDSGRGYMAVSILFLVVGLIGVMLQANMDVPMALNMLDIDGFAVFLKLIVYTVMILVAIAGGNYMNKRVRGHGEFWALFLFVTLAMSFAVSATNLLLLFLTIEFLSITSYILVGFERDNKRSTEAGVKYFLYGSVASAIMLYGMSLLYGASGSLNLHEIGVALAESTQLAPVILPAALLTLVGLGFKTSLAPFFQWAPDTYDGAPTPITAYLSTASKAVGFAVMVRVFMVAFPTFYVDWVPVLSGLSILTMSVGNLMALRQTNVKRMLAYSSVAQAGYILMGLVAVVIAPSAEVSSLSMNGLNGVLIYLFAYLFTNIGAFMVVMAVEDYTGSAEIGSFDNLVQRSPGLAWAMFIFLLSLTGIPLTGGFMGKFYVFGAAVQHQYYWLAAFGLINAGLAAFYYLNVVRAMFFSPSEDVQAPQRLSVGAGVQIVIFLCVVATFWIGLYPARFLEWATVASQQLLMITF